jgi:hypothetical protein
MKIKIINGDPVLGKALQSVESDYDGLFIDWIPTFSNSPNKAKKLLTQTNILEEAVKKNIKTILFDRYQSITLKESQWVQKHKNIMLCEPALVTRAGFTYMPFWTKILSLDKIVVDDHIRPITLLYYGKITSRIKSFEDYYIWCKTYFPDTIVAYNSEGLDQTKSDEYESKGVNKTDKNYSDAQYTIAIGNEKEYKVGYLDPFIFKALELNCVPFIPNEHRFYRGLSNHIHPKGISWYINQYESSYIGLLSQFYEDIERYYPEMKINSVVEQIYKLLV